jgi:hypothetical protein
VHAHAPYLEYLLHVGKLEEAVDRARELAETRGIAGGVVGRAFAGEALLLLGRTAEALKTSDDLDAEIKANFPDGITGRTRSYVRQFRLELSLWDADPTTVFLVEDDMLEAADSLLREASFDGWGEGLFRIERMMRVAHGKGFDDLVSKLRARIATLDPTYTPSVELPR